MTTYNMEREADPSQRDWRLTLKGVRVVIGGILVHLTIGAMFTFGNFSPYIVSYLRARTDDTELRNVDSIWVNAIGAVFHCVGMSMGGLVERRFGARLATTIGCTIFTTSILCSSFAIRHSFILFIVTYGICVGIGTFHAYGPPISAGIKWFPRHPAKVSGFVVCGFGGGALIFNQVITQFINPDNLPPDLITDDGERYFTDPDLLDRVPICFLILGGIYGAMEIVGCFLITLPPSGPTESIEVKSLEMNTSETQIVQTISNGTLDIGSDRKDVPNGSLATVENPDDETRNIISPANERTVKENLKIMLKDRNFYMMWLVMFSIDGGMQFVGGLYKAYGQTFIVDDQFLALTGSIASIFNCIGRPVWGALMDRVGFSNTIRGISASLSCVILSLLVTEQLGKAAFFIWICLAFLCFCGLWACIPSALSGMYGTTNMATNYGFLNTSNSLVGILGAVCAVTLKDIIGWHGIFFFAGSLPALCFIWTFFFNGKYENGKRI